MSIFGSLCIISGILAITLPETKGCALPETIEEIEGKTTEKSKYDNIEMLNMNTNDGDKGEVTLISNKINENV